MNWLPNIMKAYVRYLWIDIMNPVKDKLLLALASSHSWL
jgi:hypothetical protein